MAGTPPEVFRIITLSSGLSRGSNLLAMHRWFKSEQVPVELALAGFTRSDAPALEICRQHGIPFEVISTRDMETFESRLLDRIRENDANLVALCGFLKLLSASFLDRAGVPVLNIHPALLPAYGGKSMYGMAVHEAVFRAGEQRSGATVHLVDAEYDHGRILGQEQVDISNCASPAELAACVLKVEHRLYPRTIWEVFKTHSKAVIPAPKRHHTSAITPSFQRYNAVIPAQAGISRTKAEAVEMPACAGMTEAGTTAYRVPKRRPRIAIATLGCKTNFYESAGIISQFPDPDIVDFDQAADLYIINTCTVTNRTDFKSRNLIRKALRHKELNPKARIVVTGCFAQRSAEEIRALGEIDYIIDNQNKLDIAKLLSGVDLPFQDIMTTREFRYRPVSNMLGHTRAFQKIQDGCDFYCHYCAVPYARGHSRSARIEDVLAQAQLFAAQGFREIVLGGVNLGLYRDGEHRLGELVQALAKIEGIELIRLSSIEPQLLDEALLESIASIPKLCPHFHIPLQSGSDEVLRLMGRRYSSADVRKLVERLTVAFNDPAIGFDVITGYPGETEGHFRETSDFIASLPIAYLHVFSYSRRKGTPAAALKNQIAKDEKKRRTAELTALSKRLSEAYQDRLKRQQVLLRGIVEKSQDDHSVLLSDHYLRIQVAGSHPIGAVVTVPASGAQFLLDSC